MALQVLGLVAQEELRHEEAQRSFALAEAHARRPQDARIAAICAANRASSLLALGLLDEAETCLLRAKNTFERLEDRFHRRRIGWMEVALLRARGDLPGAISLAESTRSLLASVGDDLGELEVLLERFRIAQVQGDFPACEALAVQLRWLAAQLGDRAAQRSLERVLGDPSPGVALRSTRSLRVVHVAGAVRVLELDGRPRELGRRGPLLRILLGMALEPGRTFSVAELQGLGWPKERMSSESGAARVYMTVRRLRAFGLGDLLVTEAGGYRLHESLQVQVEEVAAEMLGTVGGLKARDPAVFSA
jgi:hypothetical protein